MSESDREFIGGRPNPWKYGIPLRASSGELPDGNIVEQVAVLLGRQSFCVDPQGFECEILAAAIHPGQKKMAYVESRAKEKGQFVDITIKIHYVDSNRKKHSIDIESYNPFFGCDVGFFEWYNDDVAILIYTEKHWTFAYRIGDVWPPQFVKIEERWQINSDTLSYMAYKSPKVQRLQIPSFEVLPEMTTAEAQANGLLPPDPYSS